MRLCGGGLNCGVALCAIEMTLVCAVFNFTQHAVPICRITREFLDALGDFEFERGVSDIGVLEVANKPGDIHAELYGGFFFRADEILLIADTECLELLREFLDFGFDFFVRDFETVVEFGHDLSPQIVNRAMS